MRTTIAHASTERESGSLKYNGISPRATAQELALDAIQNAMDERGSILERLDSLYGAEFRWLYDDAQDALADDVIGEIGKIYRALREGTE